MKSIKIMTGLVVAGSLLLGASTAQAWTSWGTKDGNKRMDMSANEGGWRGDQAAYSTMVRSGTSWNEPTCSGFLFVKHSNTIHNRTVPSRDGYNHIKFGDAGGALGVTYLMNNSSNRECDVIIETDLNWNIGPREPWPTEYDMEGVITHELGHVLGLGHSSNAEATMYFATGRGASKARTLHQDDENGVCSLY